MTLAFVKCPDCGKSRMLPEAEAKRATGERDMEVLRCFKHKLNK